MIYERWMTLYLHKTTKNNHFTGIAEYTNPIYEGVRVTIPFEAEPPAKILVQTREEK